MARNSIMLWGSDESCGEIPMQRAYDLITATGRRVVEKYTRDYRVPVVTDDIGTCFNGLTEIEIMCRTLTQVNKANAN
ncbi:hypothetical protein J4233_02455 [Candidatus Pacearchaeota archaeon]|nr:hypothetical protein [Candidatus Pacearchaeota archaeon]